MEVQTYLALIHLDISHCPASELNRGLSDFAEIQATISSSRRAKEEK